MKLKTKAMGLIGGALIAATMAVAVPTISAFEGRSLTAYKDVGGVWTICDGETFGVNEGQVKTHAECDVMTERRIREFAIDVRTLVKVQMPPSRHAALTSFAYNVGVPAFAGSTLLKKLNAGDTIGACDQLLRWNKVNGKVVRGLTKRRAAERELCLRGT